MTKLKEIISNLKPKNESNTLKKVEQLIGEENLKGVLTAVVENIKALRDIEEAGMYKSILQDAVNHVQKAVEAVDELDRHPYV